MNCQAAETLMLTAEPTELRGSGESELSRHVRGCTGCRVLASRILAAQSELAEALRVDADAHSVPRMLIAAAERRGKLATRLRRLAPLAAAAALAGLLLIRRTPHETTRFAPAEMSTRHDIVVTAPAGRSVAVLQGASKTNDIIVIWFF
jgi:hypothetical protein